MTKHSFNNKRHSSPAASSDAGVITADAVYTLDEIARRLKLGRWALRTMRQQGLNVHRVSGRAFVIGRDFLEFLQGQASKDVSGDIHEVI